MWYVGPHAHDRDSRRGWIRSALCLVVEAHIAADHGRIERQRRVAQPLDAADKLPHYLGALGITVIQAIRDTGGTGACASDIAGSLTYGGNRAEIRVERACAASRVDPQCARAARSLGSEHR